MLTVNRDIDKWIRPWDGQPDNLYNRDERFFSIIIKGMLAWLSNNIVMYGKPVRHFIFNTGSTYMYVETNGYKYNVTEVTDQDTIYMERPRCVVEPGNITIDTAELTQPYIRGVYERFDNKTNSIQGYNAEIQRFPIDVSFNLRYVLSTFNEALTLTQEIIDKMCFQKYFSVVYLGQVVKCSITFPQDFSIDINKIDMASSDPNNRLLNIPLTLTTSYPAIDEDTEVKNSYIISSLESRIGTYYEDPSQVSDIVIRTVT